MSTECLKKDTILKNRYRILKKLGQGGFGVTYLAADMEIEQNVVVKECFPLHWADRAEDSVSLRLKDDEFQQEFEKELRKFLDEARRMAKLQQVTEIAKVLGYFRENNTAYIVMEYVRGTNLRTYMECMEEPFTFEKAVEFLIPVIRAMEEVHKKGLMHRDLTPENILVKEDGQIKIIDFGSSREYVDEKTKTILVKSGYAPLEQYSKKEKQGPWTDVYGICAVFYEMITGAAPQDSLSRMESDELYPPSMHGAEVTSEEEDVLMKGLAQNYQQRYQNMKELEQAFLLKEKTETDEKKSISAEQKERKRLRKQILGITGGILVFCGIVGAFMFFSGDEKMEEQRQNRKEIVSYAGNYARESERYQEYYKFVKERAVYNEINEIEEYWELTEEDVLEWGEPCNRIHFHKKLEEWLEEIEESGWQLSLKEEVSGSLFEVVIKKYGAIETNFLKQNVYTWNNRADVYVSYDPVNEEILEISVIKSEESGQETEEDSILITADTLLTLSEYDEMEKNALIESLIEGTKEKSEKKGDVYLSQSLVDVHVVFGWLEKQGVFYKCKPYEDMNFSMNYEYYWP